MKTAVKTDKVIDNICELDNATVHEQVEPDKYATGSENTNEQVINKTKKSMKLGNHFFQSLENEREKPTETVKNGCKLPQPDVIQRETVVMPTQSSNTDKTRYNQTKQNKAESITTRRKVEFGANLARQDVLLGAVAHGVDDGGVHGLGRRRLVGLHPQLAGARHRATAQVHEEQAVGRVAAPADVRQRELPHLARRPYRSMGQKNLSLSKTIGNVYGVFQVDLRWTSRSDLLGSNV